MYCLCSSTKKYPTMNENEEVSLSAPAEDTAIAAPEAILVENFGGRILYIRADTAQKIVDQRHAEFLKIAESVMDCVVRFNGSQPNIETAFSAGDQKPLH